MAHPRAPLAAAALMAAFITGCGGAGGGGSGDTSGNNDNGGSNGGNTGGTAPTRTALPQVSQLKGLFGGPEARSVIAIKTDGSVYGWGVNQNYQLGTQGAGTVVRSPIQIAGFQADPASAYVGYWHSFVLGGSTPALSLGDNNVGILGDGTTTRHFTPAMIRSNGTSQGGIPFKVIAGSYDFSVGIHLSSGTLYQWGSGLGGTAYATAISYTTTYETLASGVGSVYAVQSDGTLVSWGKENAKGQLGRTSTTGNVGTPQPVMAGVAKVWGGTFSGYALRTDGTLWAWGDNTYGQLGDGSFTQRNAPVQIANDFVTISAGSYHVVGLKADGSVWTWGQNANGELGDGSFVNSPTPKKVASGYVMAVAIPGNTLIANVKGEVYGVGSNQYGTLALGDDTNLRGNFTSFTKSQFSGAYTIPAPTAGGSGNGSDALDYPQVNHTFQCSLGGGQFETKTVAVSNGPCVSQQRAYTAQVTCNNLDADFTVKSTARPFYQCAVNNSTGNYKSYYQQYLSLYQ